MEIKTEDYCIVYDANVCMMTYQGTLRLGGMEEYAPIVDLMEQVLAAQPSVLTLNLRQLEFLSSSGINVISQFVIKVRRQEKIQLIIQGAKEIAWQNKSLKNLQRLMPTLELEMD